MTINLEKIAKQIIEYREVCQRLQTSETKELYNKKLCLESELRDIVLTGNEVIELFPTIEQNQGDYKSGKLKERIEELKYCCKQSARKYLEKKRELKEEHEQNSQNESYQLQEELFEKLNSIIQNKQGTIIDEIRNILEQY